MKRVTGLGGVFFKARDPQALQQWYQRHLGIAVLEWGGAVFQWADDNGQPVGGMTIWAVKSEQDSSFAGTDANFMLNYRVEDAHGLVQVLKEEGVQVVGDVVDSEFGIFAWVMDPEGNKIELWQPPAE